MEIIELYLTSTKLIAINTCMCIYLNISVVPCIVIVIRFHAIFRVNASCKRSKSKDTQKSSFLTVD